MGIYDIMEGNNKHNILRLQRTVRFFEALLRASPDGIVITDATRNIIFVNDTFCKYFSCKRQDVIELISSQVAFSILNAQLHEETKEYAKTLEKKVEERTFALKESQSGLFSLMDDIKRTAAELDKANKRLIELDLMKSMFIASTSHELRTPLNSIIGFTSILLEGWSGELTPEQREHIRIVNTSGVYFPCAYHGRLKFEDTHESPGSG